jgi:hypothetical protein
MIRPATVGLLPSSTLQQLVHLRSMLHACRGRRGGRRGGRGGALAAAAPRRPGCCDAASNPAGRRPPDRPELVPSSTCGPAPPGPAPDVARTAATRHRVSPLVVSPLGFTPTHDVRKLKFSCTRAGPTRQSHIPSNMSARFPLAKVSNWPEYSPDHATLRQSNVSAAERLL